MKKSHCVLTWTQLISYRIFDPTKGKTFGNKYVIATQNYLPFIELTWNWHKQKPTKKKHPQLNDNDDHNLHTAHYLTFLDSWILELFRTSNDTTFPFAFCIQMEFYCYLTLPRVRIVCSVRDIIVNILDMCDVRQTVSNWTKRALCPWTLNRMRMNEKEKRKIQPNNAERSMNNEYAWDTQLFGYEFWLS